MTFKGNVYGDFKPLPTSVPTFQETDGSAGREAEQGADAGADEEAHGVADRGADARTNTVGRHDQYGIIFVLLVH